MVVNIFPAEVGFFLFPESSHLAYQREWSAEQILCTYTLSLREGIKRFLFLKKIMLHIKLKKKEV